MTSETVLNERPAESTCPLVVEVSEEFEQVLRSEHACLSAEANPRVIGWDPFLEVCILVGLDEIKQLNAEKALALVEEELQPVSHKWFLSCKSRDSARSEEKHDHSTEEAFDPP